MSAFSVGAVDYQTNAVCPLQMRFHAASVIFEYEGLHCCCLKQFLSHDGINFI